MSIRSFAHQTHARLQNATGLEVKRAHIYELMATAVGLGSHAALTTEGLLCPLPSQPLIAHYGALQPNKCALRAAVLGYPPEKCDVLATALCSEMAGQQLGLVPFEDILDVLLSGSNVLYKEEVHDDAYYAARDAALERAISESRESAEAWLNESVDPEPLRLDTPWITQALKAAAAHGEGRAHLALGLLCLAGTVAADVEQDDLDEEDLPLSDSRTGQYWYERQQQGAALTGIELEWAQSYASRAERRHANTVTQASQWGSATAHFNAAATLGQHDGLLLLADLHGDDRFFDIQEPRVRADPLWIADLADRVGRYEWAPAWIILAAERGSLKAMRELIEHHHRDDALQAWTWFHLAKLLGTDLTRDRYWAIHANGSRYDDDVGGAMFAEGIDGVRLPAATEKVRSQAESAAQTLFVQMASH